MKSNTAYKNKVSGIRVQLVKRNIPHKIYDPRYIIILNLQRTWIGRWIGVFHHIYTAHLLFFEGAYFIYLAYFI